MIHNQVQNNLGIVRYIFLIVFLIFISYSLSLKGEFTYDDHYVIENNNFVKNLSLHNIKGFFLAQNSSFLSDSTMYRPLLFLSYAWDYWLGGGKAFVFHLDSLMLHILTSLLFMLILYKIFNFSREISFILALFFGLQPANSQSVCFISARGDILFSLFLLGAFYFYARNKHWLSLLLFVLGVLSKETAVVFLPLIIAYDLLFKQRKKLTFYLAVVVTIGVYLSWRYILFSNIITTHFARSRGQDLILFARSFFSYFSIWFLPFSLSIKHSLGENYFLDISGIAIFMVAFSLSLFLLKKREKKAFLGFLWGIFPLLILVLGSFNVPLGEQRIYFSGFGFVIFLGVFAAKIRKDYLHWFLIFAFMLTAWRSFLWSEPVFIWQDAVSKYPGDWLVCENLAYEYQHRGDFQKAKAYYTKAIKINKRAFRSLYNLGTILGKEGKAQESIFYLQRAIKIKPDARAYYNLALSYLSLLRPDKEKARAYLKRAASLGYKVPHKIKQLIGR